MRSNTIPLKLRKDKKWVLTGNGKAPHNARGGAASHSDPSTWTSYTVAARAASKNGHLPGYVFSEDSPYSGADLDGCRNPDSGEIHPAAQAIIDDLASYSEVSPSGYGVHCIIEADGAEAGSKTTDVPWRDFVSKQRGKPGGLELYSSKRYFTMTGDQIEKTPNAVEPRQAAFAALLAQYFDESKRSDPPVLEGAGPTERHEAGIQLVAAMSSYGSSKATKRAALKELTKTFEPPYEGKKLTDFLRLAADSDTWRIAHESKVLKEVERQDVLDEAKRRRAARTVESVELVDLGDLIRNGIPPVECMPGVIADGLVYKKGVTGFSGHPDSSKSTLARRVGLDYMRAGGHVFDFDYENGREEVARRYLALGGPRVAALLSERLHYYAFPGAPDWGWLHALWDEFPGAIGIWDSMRGVMTSMGLNEDKAPDTAQFLDPLARLSLTRGVANCVIDHVVKSATAGTGYGRGSGDKLAAVQAQWYVDCTKPVDQKTVGEIELTRWKARSGMLPRRHCFRIGDGAGMLPFERLNAMVSRTTKLDKAIIAYLRSEHPKSVTQSSVEECVDGTAKFVRERLQVLAESDTEPVGTVKPDGSRWGRFAYVPELDFEGAQVSVD